MSIEVLKQALEALNKNNQDWKRLADSGDAGYWKAEETDLYKKTEQAATFLRQIIAEAEKEPALNCKRVECMGSNGCIDACWKKNTHPQPKAEQEPKREPLTDEQIERIWESLPFCNGAWETFARAIEAAHGIKGQA